MDCPLRTVDHLPQPGPSPYYRIHRLSTHRAPSSGQPYMYVLCPTDTSEVPPAQHRSAARGETPLLGRKGFPGSSTQGCDVQSPRCGQGVEDQFAVGVMTQGEASCATLVCVGPRRSHPQVRACVTRRATAMRTDDSASGVRHSEQPQDRYCSKRKKPPEGGFSYPPYHQTIGGYLDGNISNALTC